MFYSACEMINGIYSTAIMRIRRRNGLPIRGGRESVSTA